MLLGFHIRNDEGLDIGMKSYILQEMGRCEKEVGVRPTAVQIFTCGPTSSKPVLSDKDKKELKNRNFYLMVHSSYYCAPWPKKPEGQRFAQFMIKRELFEASAVGADGLIIHLPSRWDKSMRELMKPLPKNPPVMIYLEMVAALHVPGQSFDQPEVLGQMWKCIKKEGRTNYGICIDTAHLHAAGMRIFTHEDALAWIERFNKYVGHDCPITIALNDNCLTFAEGRDQHAPFGWGNIWPAYLKRHDWKESGLAAFVEWGINTGASMIIERGDQKPKFDGLPEGSNIMHDMRIICQHYTLQ